VLRTRLCELLGIELPIIAAPMGAPITGPELAAAVSNAGGLGIMSFGANPPPLLRDQIRRARALTTRPFGVNLILHLASDEQVAIRLAGSRPRTPPGSTSSIRSGRSRRRARPCRPASTW
jgi:NAD(P)H-dependent flavin oxidoreductase YrpB (nitropropane dioxygenase family)